MSGSGELIRCRVSCWMYDFESVVYVSGIEEFLALVRYIVDYICQIRGISCRSEICLYLRV